MPEELDGLPLHPLVVHAVVVLVPLTALVAVLFLVPRFRRALRWPMVLLAFAALASTYAAKLSGEDLKEAVVPPGAENSPVADLVERHEDLAGQLLYVMIGFAIVVWIAAYVLRPSDEEGPFPGTMRDDDDGSKLDPIVRSVVAVLLVIGAVAAGVQTYRTGEQGSRAVWNPTGEQDFGIGAVE